MRSGIAFESSIISSRDIERLNIQHKSRPASGKDRATEIVKAFNTWSFKREQPDTVESLTAVARKSLDATRPLSFVLYWGKGPRDEAAAPELQCLDYLGQMRSRIAAVSELGASFTLIFTDTHASLNGHSQARAQAYFADVRRHADEAGFSTCFLSDLVGALEPCNAKATEDMAEEMLAKLQQCARKWYRGEGDHVQGARDYFQLNMIERRAVERAYPDSVFVTFNSSEYRALFPANMPIFYMYSLRKGFAVKPWFIDVDAAA